MFASFRDSLALEYSRYEGKQLELEVRFGTFVREKFVPGVKASLYWHLLKELDGQPLHTRTIDQIQGTIRKTTDEETQRVTWLKKERVWDGDVRDYGLRLSLSHEEIVEEVDNFTPSTVRTKDRYTFNLAGGRMKLDLTYVTEQDRYEVELEWKSGQVDLDLLSRTTQLIWLRLYDTVELYTAAQANDILRYTNSILKGKPGVGIDTRVLIQARDLKLADMVIGGLVGNRQTTYTVSHKADGQRCLLVFHSSGVWLIIPPQTVVRISSRVFTDLLGTVLDAEDVPRENRIAEAPGSLHWCLLIDCLAHNGTPAIQQQPHVSRLQVAQLVADRVADTIPALSINTLQFWELRTVAEFYERMKLMFASQAELPYKQDGFIFRPANVEYNPHSERHPLKERRLIVYPDMCKWKPKEQLTIDFSIDREDGQIRLYVGAEQGQLVPFTGTVLYPFQPQQVNSVHPLTQPLAKGTIVEYRWVEEQQWFEPVRIRFDKVRPNRQDIAIDVWEDLHQPIEPATLRGEDLTLMNAYHERIRTQLYLSLARADAILLDLGQKTHPEVYNAYGKVIVYQPKEAERLRMQTQEKVIVVKTEKELLKAIGTSRVSVAIIDDFNRSYPFLSQIDQIAYFVLDADATMQLFNPMFGGVLLPSPLQVGDVQFQYNGEMLNWRMNEQSFTVQPSRISTLLSKGWTWGQTPARAITEAFLGPPEILFTRIYSYGVLKGEEKALPPPPVVPPVVPRSPLARISLPSSPRRPSTLPALPGMKSVGLLSTRITPAIVEKPLRLVSLVELQLPGLPVITPPTVAEEVVVPPVRKALQPLQPDEVEELGKRMVRIGAPTLSSFFHAMGNAAVPAYQEGDDVSRALWAEYLRKDLALLLARRTPIPPEVEDIREEIKQEFPDVKLYAPSNYDAVGFGMFLRLYLQQLRGEITGDYSRPGLQMYLSDSAQPITEIWYRYLSTALELDFYILDAELRLLERTGTDYPAIVLLRLDNHYETMGLITLEGIQTYFPTTHPFLASL